MKNIIIDDLRNTNSEVSEGNANEVLGDSNKEENGSRKEDIKSQDSGGITLFSILVVLGLVAFFMMGLYVMVDNQRTVEYQKRFLNLEPTRVYFHSYVDPKTSEEALPKSLLNKTLFQIEYSDTYYGSTIENDKVGHRGMEMVVNYKFILPTELKNNEAFKVKFKESFFAAKNELNKKTLEEVNFDNIYKLQKEMDALIISNVESSEGFKLLTPTTQPEYGYILKLN